MNMHFRSRVQARMLNWTMVTCNCFRDARPPHTFLGPTRYHYINALDFFITSMGDQHKRAISKNSHLAGVCVNRIFCNHGIMFSLVISFNPSTHCFQTYNVCTKTVASTWGGHYVFKNAQNDALDLNSSSFFWAAPKISEDQSQGDFSTVPKGLACCPLIHFTNPLLDKDDPPLLWKHQFESIF